MSVKEDPTTCPLCLVSNQELRVLPCAHAFCVSCIKNFAGQPEDQLQCVLCGAAFTLPVDGFASLPLKVPVAKASRKKPTVRARSCASRRSPTRSSSPMASARSVIDCPQSETHERNLNSRSASSQVCYWCLPDRTVCRRVRRVRRSSLCPE
jgi:hypothetical protein